MGNLIISYAHCHDVNACVVLPLQEEGAVTQVSLVFAEIDWSRGVILGPRFESWIRPSGRASCSLVTFASSEHIEEERPDIDLTQACMWLVGLGV